MTSPAHGKPARRSPKTLVPWTYKAAITGLVVFLAGAGLLVAACVTRGWEALGLFAWGVLLAASGLLGALIFSVVCAAQAPTWRTRALLTSAGTLAVLVALYFFWRSA